MSWIQKVQPKPKGKENNYKENISKLASSQVNVKDAAIYLTLSIAKTLEFWSTIIFYNEKLTCPLIVNKNYIEAWN